MREVSGRAAEPLRRFLLPQRYLVAAVVDPEPVPHTGPDKLAVEPNVLRREEVLVADVETK